MRDESLPINQVIVGDVLDVLRTLPDECVDCVVTSPPYWGLRDYGTASWEGGDPECDHAQTSPRFNGPKQTTAQVSGHASKAESHNRTLCPKCGARRIDRQIGLEATPEEFVAKMVEVFREVRRVLAGHGTCWVNLGSSYCSGTDANRKPGNGDCASWTTRNQPQRTASVGGFKPKDMVPIPWMVAMALQADGWWLRQDIILSKRNPMPESCTDRCTKSHEYFFLLTKKDRYYFDNEAIKEPNSEAGAKRLAGKPVKLGGSKNSERADMPFSGAEMNQAVGRNKRSVWEVVTEPTKEAHFATFGQKWIEPCILAGCPREVCRVCGKPRERVVERSKDVRSDATGKTVDADGSQVAAKRIWERTRALRAAGMDHDNPIPPSTTIGWTDCGHGDYRPGIVLDPFGGSGTTGVVAAKLKRDYILIELNERYANDIARPRLAHVETGVTVTEQRAGQLPLFAGKRKENQ